MEIIEYVTYSQDANKDASKDIVQKIGFNTSSMLVINHVFEKTIKKIEEMPKHTPISLISDIGGILGIFLGFSFLSIHSALIGPLLEKLESK